MVAIALPTTSTAPGRARRHPLPPVGPGREHRPTLTLVPPHQGSAPAPRRLVSVVATALLALAVLFAGAQLARTPAAAPGAAATSYVAAEGDTMWSIALGHAPAGEAAGYVEALVAANGTASVAAGQTVVLPVP
jgi:hypothetical protein